MSAERSNDVVVDPLAVRQACLRRRFAGIAPREVGRGNQSDMVVGITKQRDRELEERGTVSTRNARSVRLGRRR